MFSIGETVRIYREKKEVAEKAIISLINDDSTVDVILSTSNEEISAIPINSLTRLEDFEEVTSSNEVSETAEVIKERANKLFSLKDYSSAIDFYKKGIKHINNKLHTLSIGTNVLIEAEGQINYRLGMISDVKVKSVDVIYSSQHTLTNSEEEEEDVPLDRIVTIAPDINSRKLQRSIYLNIARCYFKLKMTGWAIKYSSIAIGVAASIMTDFSESGNTTELKKILSDCYVFRAKTLLAGNRPKFASKDAVTVVELDHNRGNQLQQEINQFKLNQQKSNRKLAREIAKWVETAMDPSKTVKPSVGQENDLLVPLDDKEEVQAGVQKEQRFVELFKPFSSYNIIFLVLLVVFISWFFKKL